MKKLALFVAVLLVSFGLQAQGNALDSRINLSVSRNLALAGTNVVFSPSQSVGERNSYSWDGFKYEIQRVGVSRSVLSGSLSQKSFGQCPDLVSVGNSTSRNCTFQSPLDRIVIGAPGDSNVGNPLSLTSMGSDALSVRVRAWLDLDGDNRPSAFEPISLWRSVSFISADLARPYVNFEVSPPLLGDRSLEAYIADGGNPSFGSGLFSLTDVNNLRVRLVSCDALECDSSIVAGVFQPHPQFQSYLFTGQKTNWYVGRYRAELLYVSDGNDDYVLAEREFNYQARSVASVSATVTASDVTVERPLGQILPFPWEQAYRLPTSQNSFKYLAHVSDTSGKPVSGAEVHIYIDLKELASQTSLFADGVRLQSAARDQVIITRVSDEEGSVSVEFTSENPSKDDVISIELSTQGFRGQEYLGTAGRQIVYWKQEPEATMVLTGGQSSAGASTNLTVKILTDSGPLANSTVIFSAKEPLNLGRTTALTNGTGEATTTLNLSHMAVGSGSAEVEAMAVYGGEVISSSFMVAWDSNLAALVATPKPVNVASGFSWSSSESVTLRPGTTNQVTLELIDSLGNLVTASPAASVAVSYTGVGLSVGSFPTRTDSLGRIQFNLLAGANDSGSGQIIVSFVDPRTGGTATKTIPVQVASNANSGVGNQKLNVGSFKGYIAIYALNYTGQRLTARVAGRWLVQENLSRYERVTRNTGAGYTVKVDLYIDGKFVRSETVVTK